MAKPSFLQRENYLSRSSRGLIAGFVGGVAGTLVKSLIEVAVPVRRPENKSAQVKIVNDLAVQLTGSKVAVENEPIAEQLVNLPFGGSLGATYGYGKRKSDKFKPLDGIAMGATTWAATHEISLPLVGLEEKPKDIPVKMQFNELLAHVAFGITCEYVRSKVARTLND